MPRNPQALVVGGEDRFGRHRLGDLDDGDDHGPHRRVQVLDEGGLLLSGDPDLIEADDVGSFGPLGTRHEMSFLLPLGRVFHDRRPDRVQDHGVDFNVEPLLEGAPVALLGPPGVVGHLAGQLVLEQDRGDLADIAQAGLVRVQLRDQDRGTVLPHLLQGDRSRVGQAVGPIEVWLLGLDDRHPAIDGVESDVHHFTPGFSTAASRSLRR